MSTTSKKDKAFALLDANAIIHRSYHALPPLTAPDGTLVNAVYGFAAFLLKILRELSPGYVAAAFDLAAPTFRHKQYEAYKATRVKAPDDLYAQIPLVKRLLGAFNIPVFEKEGFEADDVIGTIARIVRNEQGVTCYIATGDTDTLQLVGGNTKVYTLKTGIKEAVIYDESAVMARYGIMPVQLADFKGLKGDTSDNIPGVPGIGDKTASALLQKFGTMEKMYADIEKLGKDGEVVTAAKRSKKKNIKNGASTTESPLTEKLVAKLLEYRDQAFFSKELATINCEVPLDFTMEKAGRGAYKRDDAVQLFREWGFLSLVERLDAAQNAASAPMEDAASGTPDGSFPPFEPSAMTVAAVDAATLERLAQGTAQEPLYLHLSLEELMGTVRPGILMLSRGDVTAHGAFEEIASNADSAQRLSTLLGDASVPKVCHGAKAMMPFLEAKNLSLRNLVFDTEIACGLVKPGARDTSLTTSVLQELGEEVRGTADAVQSAAAVARNIRRLYEALEKKLDRQGLRQVFVEIELPLIPVLRRMEAQGVAIDVGHLKALEKKFEQELARLEKEIHAIAGVAFNINSTKELRDILFNKMKIAVKGLRKTAGGVVSTQASELEKLKGAHPIMAKLLQYREFFKIKTTYLEPLPLMTAADGRVHTTYQQLGAATGRLSSENPNLQNIPIRGEWGKDLRAAFVAEKGWRLLAADYSQLELRIAAHFSKDPVMREAFLAKEDIHTRTAALVFGVPQADVTKEMRAQAKTLNFGVLYGMGPQAFAEASDTPLDKAKDFIAGYFREFSALRGYLDAIVAEARSRGYTETLFGRRRYIPELNSQNFVVKRAGERMAVNMPIQGTEADIVKLAMVRIAEKVEQEKLADDIRMLLTVHDELVFEVREGAEEKAVALVKEEMEGVVSLTVPLTVECKIGANWGEMERVM